MMTRPQFVLRRNAYFDRLANLGAHDALLAFSRHPERQATAIIRARMRAGYAVLEQISAATAPTEADFTRADGIFAAEGL